MIQLTFPDNSVRAYEAGTTGLDCGDRHFQVAGQEGCRDDPRRGAERPHRSHRPDANIEIVTRDDPRALELIRHDAAHVMAEAVQELWPGTQVTIGPVIENGFYYDFKRVHPEQCRD
jgi:threonyl-tRNA synthetase